METWGHNKTETKVLTANYFTPLLSIKYTGFFTVLSSRVLLTHHYLLILSYGSINHLIVAEYYFNSMMQIEVSV